MTNLIRYSPFSETRNLQREFDRLFNGFFPETSRGGEDVATWTPRVDLGENEQAYLIHADLPGIAKEDVELNYEDGTLTISGTRHEEATEEGANFVRIERRSGHFYRAFSLPKAVDVDQIEAKYEDGVLRIRVPKAAEAKPRRITVG